MLSPRSLFEYKDIPRLLNPSFCALAQWSQTTKISLWNKEIFTARVKHGEWVAWAQITQTSPAVWGKDFKDKIWSEDCRVYDFLLIGWCKVSGLSSRNGLFIGKLPSSIWVGLEFLHKNSKAYCFVPQGGTKTLVKTDQNQQLSKIAWKICQLWNSSSSSSRDIG